MATIVTRVTGATAKNAPLTSAELDTNFINLNTDKLEASWTGNTTLVTLGTVTTGTWNATTISTTKGGTGLTSFTSGGAVYATSTSALTTGTLPVTAGGTGVTTSTGSGSNVLSTSPVLVTPTLGVASATSLTTTGDITVGGNLTVTGTTTTVNSTTVTVADKNLELGKVTTPTNLTADGGGITLKGATDKTFNWVNATSAWTSSEHIALAAGKDIIINGATSGSVTLLVPDVSGTTTATFQAITGTVALTSDIKNGTLGLTIGVAGATNTTVTVGTGTGFSANAASNSTYDLKIGPALTNLATLMTSGSTGFIKRTGVDNYSIDTNTYLTAEADTLQTVTTRGATSNAATVSLTASTTSTSSSTGTLVVTGGVGVGGNINVAGNAVIAGDLTVNGTTTTINSTTISVDDKNIELGSVTTPTNTTADGGGITLKGATDKTFNWVNATSAWTSSEHIDIASGKVLKINGIEVLSAASPYKIFQLPVVSYVPTQQYGSFNQSNTTLVTVTTVSNHGLVTGDYIDIIEGSSLSFYGMGFSITKVSDNQFTYVDSVVRNGTSSSILFAKTSGNTSVVSRDSAGAIHGSSFIGGAIYNAEWSGQTITPSRGGTGVNNGTKTITLGGNLTTSGSFSTTFTATGNTTVTLPTTGTLATTTDIKNGTLGLSIGTAGATNTTVTIGTGTGFSANASTNYTYDIKVGPALTNLATLMTTAGAGFIKRGATADTYTIDTNTYLTSQNSDFSTFAIGTDSGYTWGTANTNTNQVADVIGDTLTLVNGGGINLYANTVAGTDAIKIEHADTSSATNLTAAARTYVTGLTFDTYGHVTGYTTGAETAVTITDDVATDASYYPSLFTATSGSQTTAKVSSSKLYFNPSTGTLNSTIFNSLSDITQKTDISTIENATETLSKIDGVEFAWKENGKKSAGVIAQQLEKVLPFLVDTNSDGIKSVNYSGLIAYLIESNKELSKRIEFLENK